VTVAELDVILSARTESLDRGLKQGEASVKAFARTAEGETGKAARSVEQNLERISKRMGDIGKRMTLTMTTSIAGAMAGAVKSFADFDKAMTESTAIMGNVSETMRRDMVSAAREVATETTYSAKQAAEAYYFLASAGKSAEQSIALLPKVAAFAQAGAFDLARATDLLTDAQSALGLSSKNTAVDMANMARVGDVLVKANTLANASVAQFSEAITNKAGAALRLLNKDLEEGAAVLSVFADQGLKGEAAGETLALVLRDLQRASLENEKIWKQMNVQVYDATGKMRNMADIVQQLETVLIPMSDAQRRAAMSMMGFQDRSLSNIQALLGASDAIRTYEAALREAAGTTDEVANNQLKSFAAQWELMKSQVQDLAITIGEDLAPIVAGIAERVRDATRALQGMSPEVRRMAMVTAGLVAATGPLLIAMSALINSIRTIIMLKGAYVAAAMAKAAANGAITTSAAAATVAMMRLHAATLGLIALAAVPIIITVKAVFDFSNAAAAAEKAAKDAASFSFSPEEYVKQQRGRGDTRSRAELYEAFKRTRHYEPFMRSGPEGHLRDNRVADAERRASADRAAEAAKARMAAGVGGITLPSSGGGSKAPKLSEAERAARDEIAAYREQIGDLNMALKLRGDLTEASILRYKVENGLVGAGAAALAKQTLALTEQRDKMLAAKEAAERVTAAYEGLQKQLTAGGMEGRDAIAFQAFGKAFDALTDPKNREVIDALYRQAKDKEAAETSKQLAGTLEGMAESLRYQLALKKAMTQEDRAQLDLAALRARSGDLDPAKVDGILSAARAIDADDRRDAALKKWGDFWARVMQTAKEVRARLDLEAAAARDRFDQTIQALDDRLDLLTGRTTEAKLRFREMVAEFGGGPEGEDRAQEWLDRVLQIEKIETWRREMDDLHRSLEDGFLRLFDRIWEGGFRNLFGNIIGGFRQMMADMAREWLASQFRRAIQGIIGRVVGAAVGGNPGGGGEAVALVQRDSGMLSTGGPALSHRPYIVGENGPELFVPNTSGRVTNAPRTAAMAGGGGGVVIHVHGVQDAESFRRSRDQIAAEMGAAIGRANRRNR
jgi:TP901 family phage tail tape measure protein